MNMRTFILGLLALIFTLSAGTLVTAQSYGYGVGLDDPYSMASMQYDQVGTYYQAQRQVYYNYESTYNYYDYIAPPRSGGWYGTGVEWLVGLRTPMATPVPPVYFTNYYQPACGWPCWTGGHGYPRARAADFPYRSRLGGIFSY